MADEQIASSNPSCSTGSERATRSTLRRSAKPAVKAAPPMDLPSLPPKTPTPVVYLSKKLYHRAPLLSVRTPLGVVTPAKWYPRPLNQPKASSARFPTKRIKSSVPEPPIGIDLLGGKFSALDIESRTRDSLETTRLSRKTKTQVQQTRTTGVSKCPTTEATRGQEKKKFRFEDPTKSGKSPRIGRGYVESGFFLAGKENFLKTHLWAMRSKRKRRELGTRKPVSSVRESMTEKVEVSSKSTDDEFDDEVSERVFSFLRPERKTRTILAVVLAAVMIVSSVKLVSIAMQGELTKEEKNCTKHENSSSLLLIKSRKLTR